MAPSANATLDFTRDQLIRMGFQLAGLLAAGREPTAEDTGMAADFMNLELMALQAEGVVLRTIERTALTLVPGTAAYTLPADTIDVQLGPNDQAGTIVQTSGAEVLVTSMARAEYMDLADKTGAVTARPTSVYIERQALVTLVFWPVPDAESVSFRYARVRLLRDMDTGAVTVDLARRWLQYVAYAVAAHLARAKNLGLDVVGSLESRAEVLKARAKGTDKQAGKVRWVLAHSGRHW